MKSLILQQAAEFFKLGEIVSLDNGMSKSRRNQSISYMFAIASMTCFLCGCRLVPNFKNIAQPRLVNQEIQNPIEVPMLDRFLVMDEISDEVDDYFRIAREEQIRVVDSVMTEGWIETWPRIGSTILEPWHHDSTGGFEKLHASLQTVRRQAKVRITPTGDSYSIDVKVFKELEDNPNPVKSAVSGKFLRHDSALDIGFEEPWRTRQNDGWISMGRDVSLEQKILNNIVKRLSEADVTSIDRESSRFSFSR